MMPQLLKPYSPWKRPQSTWLPAKSVPERNELLWRRSSRTDLVSPKRETYMPHPPLQAEDLPELHMWGYTTDELMF